MHGKDFLDKLELAFPGLLRREWTTFFKAEPDGKPSDFDRWLAGQDAVQHPVADLAGMLDAHLTPEVVRKARASRGITDKPKLRKPEPPPPPPKQLEAAPEVAEAQSALPFPGISKADLGALLGGIVRDVVSKEVGALKEEVRRSTGDLARRLGVLEDISPEHRGLRQQGRAGLDGPVGDPAREVA